MSTTVTRSTASLVLPVLDATVAEFADRVEVCDCHADPDGGCRDVVVRVLSAEIFDQLAAAGYRAVFHRFHACAWCGPQLDWHCRTRDEHYGWHRTAESTRRRSREDELLCKACGGPLASEGGCFELVPVRVDPSAVTS